MNIDKIEIGTVIDHIPCGEGLKLVPLLRLHELSKVVSIGLNLPSDRMGSKDLIKVEGRFFSEEELNQIALLAPEATISLIEMGAVRKKFAVKLPEKVENLYTCRNTNCITRGENVNSSFTLHQTRSNIILNCEFCGTPWQH
jgi:aspartate carbamoyltransferase regulatory subunit